MTAAGASAALAGLVFVALSVNIKPIIQFPHLPSRAAATIATLILILVCSMVTLIHQRLSTLGAEVLAFSLCGAWLQSVSAKNAFAARMQLRRPLWESILHAVLGQVQLLPFVVGAVLLLNGHDRGFYWIASGCIAIFIVSVWNAWVLLVEILR